MIAMVVALREEANPILKTGGWVLVPTRTTLEIYKGVATLSEIILGISGTGRKSAEDTIKVIISEFKPRSIISMGFAGALQEGLSPGDIIVIDGTKVLNGSPFGEKTPAGETISCNPGLIQAITSMLKSAGVSYHVGPSLTTTSVICDPQRKHALGRQTSAEIVEMESGWISILCHQHGVPFIAIRVILDSVNDSIPSSPRNFLRLLFSPRQLTTMLKLLPNLRRAQAALGIIGNLLIAEGAGTKSCIDS